MKKFSKIAASLLLCILMLAQIFSVSASEYPAAAKIAGPATATVDDQIELIVSCEGNYLLGVSGYLEYDASALQFVSASAEIAGKWIVETNNVAGKVYFAAADSSSTAPIDEYAPIVMVTFKALKAGKSTVAIKELTGSAGNGDIEGTVTDAYTVTVAEKPVVEYDDYDDYDYDDYDYDDDEDDVDEKDPYYSISLKKLKVKGFKLKPEFSADVKTYEITVPFETKSLEITALAADPNSKVTIKDADLKYVGKNITRIVVTSENGSKRTYKIYTTRLEKGKSAGGDAEDSGFPSWLLFVLIGAAVLVIAVVVILVILSGKKKNDAAKN